MVYWEITVSVLGESLARGQGLIIRVTLCRKMR